MVTKNSTTITLTGSEQAVQFDRSYPYFWVQNLGGSDVLISMDSGIIDGADGVITVPAGGSCGTMHGYPADKLYLLGSGQVQIMGTGSAFNPFKAARKGGENNVQPIVLFEGTDDGYTLADGFTGFSEYYTDTPTTTESVISKWQNAGNESQYGYRLCKDNSINNSAVNNIDSAIYLSNEQLDLTNYNTICIDFYGTCDYNGLSTSDSKKMGAYFRIDKPVNLPQSKKSYDWSDWNNMLMYYQKYGKYYFDISQLTGKHHLCFGIYHGTYYSGYTNGIKIYKMMLM